MAIAFRTPKGTVQRVAARLKQLRKSAKLTQAQVAERVELDNVTVSRFESGIRVPTLEQLEKFSVLFKVPVSHFLDEANDPGLINGRELAGILASLNLDQQDFVMQFVRLYADSHKKKTRPTLKRKEMRQ